MKKIAVLVSGGGTNLQALIDAKNRGEIPNGEFALVVSSSPTAYALERAAKAGIETVVVNKADYTDRHEMTRALVAKLQEHSIDLVVFAGFMYILTEEITQAFPNRMMNVHPALIPAFCGEGCYGLHVHEKVLEYGVKLSGATVHFVSEECDGGPIILQKAVAVEEGDTPEALQRRIMEQAEWTILPRAVSLFCDDKLTVDGRKVIIKEN